jgi:hypothetical protein
MASHVHGKIFWVACSGIGGFKVCEPSWNDANDATTNQSILLFFPHIYRHAKMYQLVDDPRAVWCFDLLGRRFDAISSLRKNHKHHKG